MEATTKKKKFQFPDVYALIFILCCLAMVLTWIIPAGTFERVTEGTLTKVVAGTFQHVDSSPQTPWAMLQAIYQGFINSAGTIFLIFFCGASVAMVEESHALSDFFTWLARKLKGKEMLAIAILMYGLGLGNAAGAFANIGVALMPIGIVMSNAIGGDAFLAFLIIYYGLQSGFSIGFANPSILGVAQTMAEIPIFSGTNVRVVCCLANITFLYIVTMLYYRRIRKDPTKSLNYGSDFHSAFEVSSDKVDSKMTKRQILTAAVFLLGVVLCVGLTIACKWNAKKIASYFFGMMIVIGLVSTFSTYWFSDKLAIASMGARAVTEQEAPALYRIVRELSAKAGKPMPRIYVAPTMSPNAFATGRNERHAAVCCTQGILNILNEREIRGVLGHELMHVYNHDILTSAIASALATIITYLGYSLMYFGGGRSNDRDNSSGVFGLIGALLSAILVPIGASLVQMAISRTREFDADEDGSRLTGDPEALASALNKISYGAQTNPMPKTAGTQSVSSMMIANPFSARGFSKLFSTHPPTDERISRLMQMSQEMRNSGIGGGSRPHYLY